MYVLCITHEIRHADKSKHNLNRENQIILLIITDGKKWYSLAVKKMSALLRGITSNHKEDFYCLNCFHSYNQKINLTSIKKICGNYDYCYVEMRNEDKISKYNQREKSMKVPFVIYVDSASLLEKMNTCHNNPKNSSTTK